VRRPGGARSVTAPRELSAAPRSQPGRRVLRCVGVDPAARARELRLELGAAVLLRGAAAGLVAGWLERHDNLALEYLYNCCIPTLA